jgi:hypothetical protein
MFGAFRLSATIGRPSPSSISENPYRSSSVRAKLESGELPVCAKNKISLWEFPTSGHTQSKAAIPENLADPPFKKIVIMKFTLEPN